jgi:hypothetical protein
VVVSEFAVSVAPLYVMVSGALPVPSIVASTPAVGTPLLQSAAVVKLPLPPVQVVEVVSSGSLWEMMARLAAFAAPVPRISKSEFDMMFPGWPWM